MFGHLGNASQIRVVGVAGEALEYALADSLFGPSGEVLVGDRSTERSTHNMALTKKRLSLPAPSANRIGTLL